MISPCLKTLFGGYPEPPSTPGKRGRCALWSTKRHGVGLPTVLNCSKIICKSDRQNTLRLVLYCSPRILPFLCTAVHVIVSFWSHSLFFSFSVYSLAYHSAWRCQEIEIERKLNCALNAVHRNSKIRDFIRLTSDV